MQIPHAKNLVFVLKLQESDELLKSTTNYLFP